MIYLIKSYLPLGKYIYKVGFTDNMIRRYNHYFYANPGFEIVSTREGDEILEKLLHYYLYYKGFQYKKNGKLDEWFLGNIEVRNIFHYSREKIEKELWKHRDKILDINSSTDFRLFEYLYQRNKESFFGNEFISVAGKIIKTPAKSIDIQFWRKYLNNQVVTESFDFVIKPEDELIQKSFIQKFYATGVFSEKMRMYCEFCDSNGDNLAIMKIIDAKITDPKFKEFYKYYGTKGCSARRYRENELISGWNDITKESQLLSSICVEFKLGEKYTLKEIKTKLDRIYRSLDLSRKAKATDLGRYFNLIRVKFSDPITKKRIEGYKLESL